MHSFSLSRILLQAAVQSLEAERDRLSGQLRSVTAELSSLRERLDREAQQAVDADVAVKDVHLRLSAVQRQLAAKASVVVVWERG